MSEEKAMETERLTYTVEEAARLFGISRGLAYEMARCGELPVLRFGKRMVVPKRAVDHMLEGTNTPGPSGG